MITPIQIFIRLILIWGELFHKFLIKLRLMLWLDHCETCFTHLLRETRRLDIVKAWTLLQQTCLRSWSNRRKVSGFLLQFVKTIYLLITIQICLAFWLIKKYLKISSLKNIRNWYHILKPVTMLWSLYHFNGSSHYFKDHLSQKLNFSYWLHF